MKMGVISKTGKTEIKISKEEWRSMEGVGLLAISVEKKGSNIKIPTGKILIKGMLNITSSH
jgi:anti-sigma-K factor RskA